jgi:tetratricopeptide (TPR) repeat protein
VKLLVATLVVALGAAEAADDPAGACNRFEDPARQIRGCTEYIRRGKAPGPNLAVAYTNRGIAYAARGHIERAIADFDEAIRLAPDSPFPYYNRANAHYDRKDYRRALGDYDAAIERDPDFALAYYNRGLARERLGRRSEAIADFQKALELDPDATAVKDRLRRLGVFE